MKTSDITTLLRAKGFRATQGKIALIAALLDSPSPESIETLAGKIKGALDAANVYRSLESFVAAGLVRRIDLGNAKSYYEFAVDRKHHHHIVCTDCGRIEDVKGCSEALDKTALKASTSFSAIQSHSLEFFGLCRPCTKKSVR
ncbi:MAG: Transcriptional regulator, Fur family [Candidatus Parcubacteria bacterium]|nr:Transcriptional regulator, Fur family [Candidatus Parcubacteria bacterium]